MQCCNYWDATSQPGEHKGNPSIQEPCTPQQLCQLLLSPHHHPVPRDSRQEGKAAHRIWPGPSILAGDISDPAGKPGNWVKPEPQHDPSYGTKG